MGKCLYLFVDESGDFNFSKKGTKYYTFSTLITGEPCKHHTKVKELQISLLSGDELPNLPQEQREALSGRFHASPDLQIIRDIFFNLITTMDSIKVNSIVIQKNKTNPTIREPNKFYPKFLSSLIDYVFKAYSFSKLCIFVDSCAVSKNKAIFKKSIAHEISKRDPAISFRIYYPPSAGFCNLQVVDYINWAIFRKWENSDLRSYNLVKHLLQAKEKNIFINGTTIYY